MAERNIAIRLATRLLNKLKSYEASALRRELLRGKEKEIKDQIPDNCPARQVLIDVDTVEISGYKPPITLPEGELSLNCISEAYYPHDKACRTCPLNTTCENRARISGLQSYPPNQNN